MNIINPGVASALGTFIDILVGVGVKEGPAIVAAIQHAVRGEDPLASLAKERVADIMHNGLQLELAMATERLRFATQSEPTP